MPSEPRFQDTGFDTGQFGLDIERARGYKPVTKKEFRQAYSQYKPEGLKFGQVKKGNSDEQLYARAKKIVLDWWGRQQKEKDRLKRRAESRGNNPNAGVGGSGASGYSGSGFGGSSGSSGGYMLPDTALGPNSGLVPNLPNIETIAERMRRDSASNVDAQRKEQRELRDKGKKPAPKRSLTSREVYGTLREMGVPKEWVPPKWATRNEDTLARWASRRAQAQDLVLRTGRPPILDRGFVGGMIRQVGVRNIQPNDVPIKYRTSPASLRSYLLSRKAAQKMARQVDRDRRAARERQLAEQLERIKNV